MRIKVLVGYVPRVWILRAEVLRTKVIFRTGFFRVKFLKAWMVGVKVLCVAYAHMVCTLRVEVLKSGMGKSEVRVG